MLPIGPKILQFNGMFATAGMSLFFILSGFLIVSMLSRNTNVASFLVRRIFRIVPLAWAFLVVFLWFHGADWAQWQSNLLFYANLRPHYLLHDSTHFWSLCVEMQFYAAIALAVGLAGRKGLVLVPIVCALVTAARVSHGVPIATITWWRIDEILAGGCLALALQSPRIAEAIARLPAFTPYLVVPLLLASSHQELIAMNYARPYFAAFLIGSTILRTDDVLQRILCGRTLRYLAQISFALYVIHPVTKAGWMGEGDVAVRYTKRIGSLILCFLFAHFSTRYYEKYWIDLGHRLASKIEGKRVRKDAAVAVAHEL